MKQKAKKIHHAHDKLFKSTFQLAEVAIDCGKYLLPPEIAKEINCQCHRSADCFCC